MEKVWTGEEITAMAAAVEITVLEHGYLREDGRWLSDEDLQNLTDKEWVEIFFEIYPQAR